MPLPPGVSSRAFAAALAEFSAAIGSEWVFSKDDDLALYRDAYSPFRNMPGRELQAGAAVAPASVEQVQQIVRIANRYKTPLYAFSTGRNLGYGAAGPGMTGCVVVDLKRMNRVLEVNTADAYCWLEPGVSFIELGRYFAEHKLPYMVAAAENGAGGPVGNALERGTSMVRGDNFSGVCGMEVVLPNGEVLRTGSGATPNPRLWPVYKYGFGPQLDGLFVQSNFGIVTKMGFWLEKQPEMIQTFTVGSPRSDDLARMVELIQGMRYEGLIFRSGAGSPVRSANNGNNGNVSHNVRGVNELLAQPDGGAASAWDALGKDVGLAVSMATGSARGPEKVVQATVDYARELFSKVPGAAFNVTRTYRFPMDPAQLPVEERQPIGFPNLWAFQRLTVQGPNRGHYYFAPNIRADAGDMMKANRVLRKVMSDFGDENQLNRWGWQGGTGFFPKNYTLLVDFVVRDDAAFNERRLKLFEQMVHAAAENGWAEYRAPAGMQDLVASTYSYNNNVIRRFSESIKDAIDPNGILSPGRGGIWPKRFRKS